MPQRRRAHHTAPVCNRTRLGAAGRGNSVVLRRSTPCRAGPTKPARRGNVVQQREQRELSSEVLRTIECLSSMQVPTYQSASRPTDWCNVSASTVQPGASRPIGLCDRVLHYNTRCPALNYRYRYGDSNYGDFTALFKFLPSCSTAQTCRYLSVNRRARGSAGAAICRPNGSVRAGDFICRSAGGFFCSLMYVCGSIRTDNALCWLIDLPPRDAGLRIYSHRCCPLPVNRSASSCRSLPVCESICTAARAALCRSIDLPTGAAFCQSVYPSS